MKQRGFTVIELMVVIIVMGILLALAFAGLRGTQTASRNETRKTNAEIIARGLEQYYNKPDNKYMPADKQRNAGRYPANNDLWHSWGGSNNDYSPAQVAGGYSDSFLPGVPGRLAGGDTMQIAFFISPSSTIVANDVEGNKTRLAANTSVSSDRIVYEPIIMQLGSNPWSATPGQDNWVVCYNADNVCNAYNLYYFEEDPMGGPRKVHVLRSKHQ